MDEKPRQCWLTTCYWVLLAVGMLCIDGGICGYPPMAVSLRMFVELPDADWHDVEKVNAIRSQQLQAEGNGWIWWLTIGVACVSLSLAGIYASKRAACAGD